MAAFAEEDKAKYLQYRCEENRGLTNMVNFLVALDDHIRREVWEREVFSTNMMELYDAVIRLGDAKEVGRYNNLHKQFGKDNQTKSLTPSKHQA